MREYYVPGLGEKDPDKITRSLMQAHENSAADADDIATNTANIATNTANISALTLRLGSAICLGSNGSALSAGATLYFGLGTSSGTDNSFCVIPVAGVLSKFFYQGLGSPGGGQTFTHTLRKGTVDTAITCSNTGGATTANDITHTVSVVAGDFISVKAVASATAANSGSNFYGVLFTPS